MKKTLMSNRKWGMQKCLGATRYTLITSNDRAPQNNKNDRAWLGDVNTLYCKCHCTENCFDRLQRWVLKIAKAIKYKTTNLPLSVIIQTCYVITMGEPFHIES